MKEIKVSIVIVCMNNIKELFPCLDSIYKYTTVSYESFVVAFMFSDESRKLLAERYPWVTIVESNELRGFSENNNLALRQAKGKYCFIVNDDTFMKSPVIDRLVEVIESLPDDVSVISPNIKYPDGSDQICGRRYYGLWEQYVATLHLTNLLPKSKYENQAGIFQTYNLSGAAFLIKTDDFKEMGWFDEYYYFCPEDVALSDGLNKKGKKCFVDADNILYHIGGNTASKVQMATIPAVNKGGLVFYSRGRKWAYWMMGVHIFILRAILSFIYRIKMFSGNERAGILYYGSINVCKTVLSPKTPKEIFISIYNDNVKKK